MESQLWSVIVHVSAPGYDPTHSPGVLVCYVAPETHS